MKEFAKSTTPDGYYNFITEVTDSQKQPLYFKDPEKYKDKVIKELMDINFLKNDKIDDIKINAVKGRGNSKIFKIVTKNQKFALLNHH